MLFSSSILLLLLLLQVWLEPVWRTCMGQQRLPQLLHG
jgi:hypothetical protein